MAAILVAAATQAVAAVYREQGTTEMAQVAATGQQPSDRQMNCGHSEEGGACDPSMICAMLCGALPAALDFGAKAFALAPLSFQLSGSLLRGEIRRPEAPPPRALQR